MGAADRSRGTAVSSAPVNKCIDLDADETQLDSEGTQKDSLPGEKAPSKEVSEAATEEVASLCAVREAVRELMRRVEERKAQVDAAGQDETLQHMKKQVVEEQASKRSRERDKVVAELTKCENDEKENLERMNEIRQRDTVLEYADMLKSKSDADSLKYLTCMVNTVQEPWRILVEVARLRDHHRALLDGWRRDSASCSRQHRE